MVDPQKVRKIIFLGNYLPDKQESMQRFARLMLENIPKYGFEVEYIYPRVILGKLTFLPNIIRKWLGYIDKYIFFGFYLCYKRFKIKKSKHLLHILDHSNAIYLNILPRIKNIVTCHDLLAIKSFLNEVPENRLNTIGMMLQKMIFRGLRKADTIVCISEATKLDCQRLMPEKVDALHMITLALNYPYRPILKEEALISLEKLGYKLNRPYILHVGSSAWYKNRKGLLRIYRKLVMDYKVDYNLLLVGPNLSREEQELIHGVSSGVCIVSGISNEELNLIYAGAEVFLFPSVQEGFGWPIIEAQASGCPLVVINREPMSSIAGESACKLDEPYIENEEVWVCDSSLKIYNSLIVNVKNREFQVEAGLENMKNYSEQKIFQKYTDLYRSLIKTEK